MSLHLLLLNENITGIRRKNTFDLSFIGPYPSGGEILTPRMLMLSLIEDLVLNPFVGYWFQFDRQLNRLHVQSLNVDTTTTGDLPVVFTQPGDPIGTPAKVPSGTPFVAHAVGGEVAVGTDLSALQHLLLVVDGF